MNKIILLLILILGQSLNAQVSSLTEDELKAKIQLDTKVEISESYMKVSAYTTLISFVIKRKVNVDRTIFLDTDFGVV